MRPLDPASLDRYRAFAAGRSTGPAQHPVWVKAWSNQPDAKPVLIEIRQSGEPVLMLPLEVFTMQGMRVARFMGGRHANSNFPAISAEDLRASEMRDVLRETLASADIPVDALALERMSPEREGRRNPLVFENARPSPNLALAVKLGTPFDILVKTRDYRGKAKKHRSQLRKFESVGGFERLEAKTPEDTARILDAFFTLKAERFKQAGIPDPFAPTPVRDAFHALFAEALAEPEPVFRLQALEVGNKPRAITGSSYGPDRITCEFGAIASDEIAKLSPGELLFFLNIKEAADKGCAFYDFGVGDEPYKRQWCDVEVELRDVFLPLTLKGKALATGMAASAKLKGALKRNQRLWQAFKSLRRRLAGSGDKQGSDG
ncbi:MAG: GNAT family N-acetyltransferase [Methylobacterium mesophilicum]|nr:GNAT family N-acetyltransferase [Methylobacterium mesophilicum]